MCSASTENDKDHGSKEEEAYNPHAGDGNQATPPNTEERLPEGQGRNPKGASPDIPNYETPLLFVLMLLVFIFMLC